jgi:hypothetical protein
VRLQSGMVRSSKAHGPDHMTVVLPQVPCYMSGGIVQDPLPQEIQLHPAIATALDQLQAVAVSLARILCAMARCLKASNAIGTIGIRDTARVLHVSPATVIK